jgi:hypothetical protein
MPQVSTLGDYAVFNSNHTPKRHQMTFSKEDILNKLLESESASIDSFREQYPHIWDGLGKAVETAGAMLPRVYALIDRTEMELFRLNMWGSVRLYQIQSLFLILRRHLDEGLAIVRMSSELTRDLRCIGDDPNLRDLWIRINEQSAQRDYRKTFKFDLTDAQQRRVFGAYNFSSDYGVHGHKTSAVYLIGVFNPNTGQREHKTVGGEGVNMALSAWMTFFFPMHNVALASFLPRYHEALLGEEVALLKAEAELLILLKEFRERRTDAQII